MVNGTSLGGIVGHVEKISTIENCYNKGSLEGHCQKLGGLIGDTVSKTTLNYCYSVGKLTKNSENINFAALIAYSKNSNTITESYFAKGIGANDESSYAKDITTSDLLNWLNNNRGDLAEWEIVNNENDGYPVFK